MPIHFFWSPAIFLFVHFIYEIANYQFACVCFSEVILTLGSSRTVMEFLCAAKEKKRSFRVFVAEGAPRSSVSVIFLPWRNDLGFMLICYTIIKFSPC